MSPERAGWVAANSRAMQAPWEKPIKAVLSSPRPALPARRSSPSIVLIEMPGAQFLQVRTGDPFLSVYRTCQQDKNSGAKQEFLSNRCVCNKRGRTS